MDFYAQQLQIFGNAKILRSRLNSRLDPRESENISRTLVEHVTGQPYVTFLMDPARNFTSEQFAEWTQAVDRLVGGEPLQYVLGVANFGELELKVGPRVLIPRPETEELTLWVEKWTMEQMTSGKIPRPKVLDIGTGSGCIAIHAALSLPAAEVHAMDISQEALAIASHNAEHLGAQVRFLQADMLSEKSLEGLDPPYDIVISNPPYIPYLEKGEMPEQVTEFEPPEALFVPNEDPLLFYRRIAMWARENLSSKGALFFEIHESLGNETCTMLRDMSYQKVEMRRDLQGKPRMVAAFVLSY